MKKKAMLLIVICGFLLVTGCKKNNDVVPQVETNKTNTEKEVNIVYKDESEINDNDINIIDNKSFKANDNLDVNIENICIIEQLKNICSNFNTDKYNNTFLVVSDNKIVNGYTKILKDKKYTIYNAMEYYKNNAKKVHTFGNYDYYELDDNYVLVNTKDNSSHIASQSQNGKLVAYNIFKDDDEEEYVGIFTKNHLDMLTGYDSYSCYMHTDSTFETCRVNEATIVQKNKNFGVISLTDFNTIIPVEYSFIFEIDNGNYLVEKNNKEGIISKTGEVLLDVSYDYVGFNKELGYIAIKGNNIEYYDTKLVKQELNDNTLSNLFDSKLKVINDNVKKIYTSEDFLFNSINISNANSYNYTGGSIITKQNINEPYYDNNVEKKNNNYRFKYTGSKYKGTQLMIFDVYDGCYKKPYIYVIDGTKVNIINSNEISIQKDENGHTTSYCF